MSDQGKELPPLDALLQAYPHADHVVFGSQVFPFASMAPCGSGWRSADSVGQDFLVNDGQGKARRLSMSYPLKEKPFFTIVGNTVWCQRDQVNAPVTELGQNNHGDINFLHWLINGRLPGTLSAQEEHDFVAYINKQIGFLPSTQQNRSPHPWPGTQTRSPETGTPSNFRTISIPGLGIDGTPKRNQDAVVNIGLADRTLVRGVMDGTGSGPNSDQAVERAIQKAMEAPTFCKVPKLMTQGIQEHQASVTGSSEDDAVLAIYCLSGDRRGGLVVVSGDARLYVVRQGRVIGSTIPENLPGVYLDVTATLGQVLAVMSTTVGMDNEGLQLSEDEIRKSANRNRVRTSVGKGQYTYYQLSGLQPGDIIITATDGVWEQFTHQHIASLTPEQIRAYIENLEGPRDDATFTFEIV